MIAPAEDVARALSARPAGNGWVAPCPVEKHGKGRGDRTPSFTIWTDANGDTGVNCHGCCSRDAILSALSRLGLVDGNVRRLDDYRTKPLTRVTAATPDPKALRIWKEGTPPQQVLETYLHTRRGIDLIPPSIRQGFEERAGNTWATMIAAVQAPNRQVIAVQRLFLTPSGSKAFRDSPRLNAGSSADGAVRLGPACDTMGLAEGVETGLAAQQLFGVSTWCCLGASRMHRVALPPEVQRLIIFADNDPPGQIAAEKTAERWTKARLDVEIRTPCDVREGGDWNDALMIMRGAA